MKLTHIEIDGRDFVLSGERDLVHVMSQIEAAAASPPAFVDLSDGDDLVSVLIHSSSRVVVSVETDQQTSSAQFEPLSYPSNDWDW